MDTGAHRQRHIQSQSKQSYLQAYNIVSAFLWLAVLGRVLLLVPLVGLENVYGGVSTWTRWTQTLAVVEVGHAALGAFVKFLLPSEDVQSCNYLKGNNVANQSIWS